MDWVGLLHKILMTVYTFSLGMVCVYGFHRYVLVYLYYRHRRNVPKPPGHYAQDQLPMVTVQLPMFNEANVAERVIQATCQIDYPKDRLQIQVLDDSTDPRAVEAASRACRQAAAAGFDVQFIHRQDRTGYKAGALANGLKTAKGEFVTIFDADFIPEPSIVRKSIDYFLDPRICAVQARWEHLNRNDSMLTKTQAIFLDGHFAIEHVARNRSGRYMQFNGTAGTWRIAAIHDAGGWQHDTLTEDMDLSYRAQLKAWKFIFLPDLTAPAELPAEMNAFKAQQFRWTKGGVQTAIKILPKILLSKAPLKNKIDAFFHLTCFSVHLYVFFLVVMLFPALYIQSVPVENGTPARAIFDLLVFTLATVSATVFYTASQYELFRDWRTVLKYMPFLMALGIGVSLSNTKALLEAVFGKKTEFVRTPKFGDGKFVAEQQAETPVPGRRKKRKILPYIEFACGLYMLFGSGVCLLHLKTAMAAPFLLMFAAGFFYVSILTWVGMPAGRKAAAQGRKLQPARQEVK
jgi:cellulose synthase/poly-beta-1,6-N-acetylglucosamine synthase-like glycosyltransferase